MALSVQIRYEQIKIGLGAYPTVTLAMARTLTKEANVLRAQGIDPQNARWEQQEQAKIAKMNTFELMARAWLESASKDRVWSAGYKSKSTRHLEIHVFPWVGDKAMETIRPPEIVRCLHRIKDRWWSETEKIADETKAKHSLYRRLKSSLPRNSPPQTLLFQGFFEGLGSAVPHFTCALTGSLATLGSTNRQRARPRCATMISHGFPALATAGCEGSH